MKITPKILGTQWSSIKFTDGGFLQVDMQHQLEWHIGYQSISQRTLLLVSDTEVDAIESSRSMTVGRRKRESDNRWTLSFELLRNEQQGVFAILCRDIIEHSSSATNEREATKQVINRYKQWSKLLESQSSGLMDERSRKGLLGELLFLEQRITTADSVLTTIQGWSGAEGADQDFMYPDGWFEIKSIGVSAVSVTISSLEQLDCVDEGELVIKRIDKVAPDKAGAFTLNEMVNRICGTLVGNVEAPDLFQTKLSGYGYMNLHEYSKQKYFYSHTQRYLVDESFPKLTKENIPMQVVSLHYELNLASLANWQKE